MPDNKPETNFDKEFKEQIQMYQMYLRSVL